MEMEEGMSAAGEEMQEAGAEMEAEANEAE